MHSLQPRVHEKKKSLVHTVCSLVPRPPPFCVLRFVFSVIHGSGRARKTGKAWSHSSCENDVRGGINRKNV